MRDTSLTVLGQKYSLKWFCGYLGVSLIQPKENMSANIFAPLSGNDGSNIYMGMNDKVSYLTIDGEQWLDIK